MQELFKNKLIAYFHTTILSFTLICIFIAGAASFISIKASAKIESPLLSDVHIESLYLFLLKSANHGFVEDSQIREFSLGKTVLQSLVHMTPEDLSTYFGRELPSYTLYNSLPKSTDSRLAESPAPLENLFKDKEAIPVAAEQEEAKEAEPPQTKNVFIYHTHSWESFIPLLGSVDHADDARSDDPKLNVISVGEKLEAELLSKGIGVEHDTRNVTEELLQNGLDANHSYPFMRNHVSQAVSANKDLEYIIDVHRDSLRKEKTTVTINGKSYAKLYFVVGEETANFEANYQLADKLNNELKEKYPGISRGVLPKDKNDGNGVYNQDFFDRSILIEVGGVDNTREELNNTIEAFSEIFSDYYWENKGVEQH
ncbi:stage II sporulation protein P [Bacillus sp. CRN 9]|nr:stage II sporulation protein P [Bacillus sp. CRN 9]